MLKNLLITLSVALILLITTPSTTQAADFVVTTSISTSSNSDCYPVKNGTPIKLSVYVKSYKKGKNTISINKSQTFITRESWVQITNNSIAVDSSQTITFDLTITPPAGTYDGRYPFSLNFDASPSGSFSGPNLVVYVDNSQPEVVTLSLSSKTSLYVDVNWYGSDAWSNSYTKDHSSSGQHGIKSFDINMKNFEGTSTIFSKSYVAPNYFPYTTSISISPNTSYKVFVTATDLAGNSKTSPGLTITTPPSAPSALTSNGVSYCSTTLTWNASPGATMYNIYNSTTTPSTKIGTTTSTSYTVTGLPIGTTNKFYVTAESNAGVSPQSTTFSVKTLSVPPISGSADICSSGTSYAINNLPSDCSVSWNLSTNLSPSSTSGNPVTFTANGKGYGWVQATINSITCGSIPLPQKNVVVGNPTPSIDADLVSGSGEPTSVLFTATPYNGASYNWYVNNVLQQSGIDNTLEWYFPCRVTKTIKCELINSCGTSDISNSLSETGGCDRTPDYAVFPNPANTEVSISQQSKKSIDGSDKNDKVIKSIRVVDKFGNVVYFQKFGDQTFESKLNVSNFPTGIYIIKINEGDDEESHTVVKQ